MSSRGGSHTQQTEKKNYARKSKEEGGLDNRPNNKAIVPIEAGIGPIYIADAQYIPFCSSYTTSLRRLHRLLKNLLHAEQI